MVCRPAFALHHHSEVHGESSRLGGPGCHASQPCLDLSLGRAWIPGEEGSQLVCLGSDCSANCCVSWLRRASHGEWSLNDALPRRRAGWHVSEDLVVIAAVCQVIPPVVVQVGHVAISLIVCFWMLWFALEPLGAAAMQCVACHC